MNYAIQSQNTSLMKKIKAYFTILILILKYNLWFQHNMYLDSIICYKYTKSKIKSLIIPTKNILSL